MAFMKIHIIKYLAAIRVWLEKQLFNTIDYSDILKQQAYLGKNTLEQRIFFAS